MQKAEPQKGRDQAVSHSHEPRAGRLGLVRLGPPSQAPRVMVAHQCIREVPKPHKRAVAHSTWKPGE